MRVSLSQEFFTNANINLESMPSQLEKVGKIFNNQNIFLTFNYLKKTKQIFRLLEVEKYCNIGLDDKTEKFGNFAFTP